MNVPTFEQSLKLHRDNTTEQMKSLGKTSVTPETIAATKDFNECYTQLHDFITNTSEDLITAAPLKDFLLTYEGMLRFIKFVNKPGRKSLSEQPDEHDKLFQVAYENFTARNLN